MTRLSLTLPPPLSACFSNAPGRGRVLSKRYRDWRAEAALEAICQRPGRIIGAFTATIMLDRPDARRRDLDNMLKATLDLLTNAHVIEDDSLAQRLTIAWSERPPGAGARVHIELEPA